MELSEIASVAFFGGLLTSSLCILVGYFMCKLLDSYPENESESKNKNKIASPTNTAKSIAITSSASFVIAYIMFSEGSKLLQISSIALSTFTTMVSMTLVVFAILVMKARSGTIFLHNRVNLLS